MALSAEILSLFLYCVQQLGIMLGAGGETVVLLAYLLAIRDGIIDTEDERFAKAVKRVVQFGIFFILTSGIGITVLHFAVGQTSILLEPAYLFKWLLIGAVLITSIIDFGLKKSGPAMVGLVGGTWYGLFMVHILAPVSTWGSLGLLFVVWMLGFMVCWLTIVRLVKGKPALSTLPVTVEKKTIPTPIKPSYTPAPIPLPVIHPSKPEPPKNLPILEIPPPQPKPAILPPKPIEVPAVIEKPKPLPHEETSVVFTNLDTEAFPYKETALTNSPMLHPHLTNERETGTLPTPPAPAAQSSGLQLTDANVTPHLPAVRIMPQKPEDLETQHHRSPLVRFG